MGTLKRARQLYLCAQQTKAMALKLNTDDEETTAETDKRSRALVRLAVLRELRRVRWLLTIVAIIFICGVLQAGRDFILPVMLSVILALVLRPVARTLNRLGAPSALSAAVVVLVLVGGLSTTLYFISGPATQWVEDAPNISREFQYKFKGIFESAEVIGDVGKQVEDIAEGPKKRNVQEVVVRSPGLLSQAATGAPEVLASFVLCLFLLYFLLSTADMFLEKLVSVLPRLRDKEKAVSIAREIETEISRYLFTVSIINCALGLCIGIGLSFTELPNPFLWGALATILNFIPYLGAVVGAAIVFAVAVVTLDHGEAIMAPPLIYLALTTIEGQLVTPWFLGRRLEMNPVVIFVGVAFWGWLWGVSGAVMAVPILLIIKVIVDNLESTSAISEFLAAKSKSSKLSK